jgi:hypothetical protein
MSVAVVSVHTAPLKEFIHFDNGELAELVYFETEISVGSRILFLLSDEEIRLKVRAVETKIGEDGLQVRVLRVILPTGGPADLHIFDIPTAPAVFWVENLLTYGFAFCMCGPSIYWSSSATHRFDLRECVMVRNNHNSLARLAVVLGYDEASSRYCVAVLPDVDHQFWLRAEALGKIRFVPREV